MAADCGPSKGRQCEIVCIWWISTIYRAHYGCCIGITNTLDTLGMMDGDISTIDNYNIVLCVPIKLVSPVWVAVLGLVLVGVQCS